MLLNSMEFFIFFPIVVLIYFCIPGRWRYIWLAAASYFFYVSWDTKYAFLLFLSILTTYLSGILLGKAAGAGDPGRRELCKKLVAAACVLVNIGILFVLKNFNFGLENLDWILRKLHIASIDRRFDIIMPIGISFYTLQALTYTIDVYRGQVPVEKNIVKYTLFVSFFPQMVSGPIGRAKNMLTQINKLPELKLWNFERVESGAVMMLWGMFLKMVVADRIALPVDAVFDAYRMYGGVELTLAAVGFAIQLYADFAGYSLMAVGAAKIMGVTLMGNFDTPYLSRSVTEFWRRWHISLSTWFRDYLYIPLGGSRKGKLRKYVNKMLTFLASGIWHGDNWTYVVWGGLHGLYQIVGEELKPVKDRLNLRLRTKTESIGYRMGQAAVNFILVDLAWIFFRSDTVRDALSYIGRIFTRMNPWAFSDGSLYALGLSCQEVHILLAALFVLLFVDLLKYHKGQTLDTFLKRQCFWFRGLVILLLFAGVFVFGVYGPVYAGHGFMYQDF